MELGRPLLVPAGLGFLGSFGAITFIRTELPDRRASPLAPYAKTHFQTAAMARLCSLRQECMAALQLCAFVWAVQRTGQAMLLDARVDLHLAP